MSNSTRLDFLEAAKHLFAEKGFYGASIADIAGELGLTKQALLHHFGSKEKLYGEVLQLISEQTMERIVALKKDAIAPEDQLEHTLLAIFDSSTKDQQTLQVIARELLDNKGRAEQAKTWYLKPFLESLIEMARNMPGNEKRPDAELFARVYQLLGAINYFAISQPTLAQIFGKKALTQTKRAFPEELRKAIRRTLV